MAALFPWLMEPDWTSGVTETLEWKTDVLASPTGAEQRIARRLSPRRTFEFSILAADLDRQWLENALFQAGSGIWAMPIFPDAAPLLSAVPATAHRLPVLTAGRDFAPGAQVLLKSAPAMNAPSLLVTVRDVEPDALALTQQLTTNWPLGTLVYPVRPAVLTDPPVLTRLNDSLSSAQMRFRVAEHNPHPDGITLALYRGFPVLEPAADRVDTLTASYLRLISELDNGTGIPARLDAARRPFALQKHNWFLSGRQEQQRLRQLLYFLRGRQRPLWVPSQGSDIRVAGGIEGNSLQVIRSGLSEMGILPGRCDLRIQLADGTILYRRLTHVAISSEQVERLALDGLPVVVPQSFILSVSFMALCRQNNDAVSWSHVTDADGVASVSTSFTGVRDELE